MHSPTECLRQAEQYPPIRSQLVPILPPLLELRELPLSRFLLLGERKVGEDLRGSALARGAPDDARTRLFDSIQARFSDLGRVGGVEVIEDRRHAGVQSFQAAGELSNANLLCRYCWLNGPAHV